MGKISIAFLPAWGAGHLISMLEFAKHLLLHPTNNTDHHLSITVILCQPPSSTFSSSTLSYLNSLTSSTSLDIHFHHLPPIDPPSNTVGNQDFISLYFQSNASAIKSLLSSSSSSPPIAALVIDFFATAVIDVADELGIPTYVYFTSTALMLSLMLHLPTLHENTPFDLEQLQHDIEIPGISLRIPPSSIPTPMLKRDQICGWFAYHGRRFREAKGIIVNTFEEIEVGPLAAVAEGRMLPPGGERRPVVYPVGPILMLGESGSSTSEGTAEQRRHECVEWLDQQPKGSVVFLCFGSKGSFDAHQVREMAFGLERSGHPFLWCLRSRPADDTWYPTDANLDEVLPEGFLERTKERGMVWPSWAPQAEILSHQAVGGFVTHCGWNSTLESLWFGVPLLAWPVYAEQHLNEVELVRDIGVAVGLKVDRKRGNFVEAAELERGVRCLMGESEEGKRVRSRAEEMKLASRKAVEEGGSSYNYMEQLVRDLSQGGPLTKTG